MCGRFAIAAPKFERIESSLGVSFDPVQPRFNISPTNDIPAVLGTPEHAHELRPMRWGLVPRWSKEPTTKYSTFNARSETVATKPSFRDSFRSRRCLIPASGFYEWRTLAGTKQPYYFTDSDGRGLAFAGLWDRWEGNNEVLFSCTILVCQPNELLSVIHDRMPVILPEEAYKTWLSPDTGQDRLQSLLVPYAAELMRGWPVDKAVGNPRNESPSLIEPI